MITLKEAGGGGGRKAALRKLRLLVLDLCRLTYNIARTGAKMLTELRNLSVICLKCELNITFILSLLTVEASVE